MTRRSRWAFLTACGFVATLLAGAGRVQAQAAPPPALAVDDHWHFVIAPYFWASGISGNVSVGNLVSVPIDASFSDIMEDFDIGLMARFEGHKGRFGFSTDLLYINLGAPVLGSLAEGLDATVDFKQTIFEGVAVYRAYHGGRADNPAFLDVLAGARYYSTRVRLHSSLDDADAQAFDWVDAVAGIRFHAPLGARFSLLGRGDVAGFGSEFTWVLEGDLAARLGQSWLVGAGWKHMGIEYDQADSTRRKLVDIAYDGPRVWFAYSW
jgi:hypothetical protein